MIFNFELLVNGKDLKIQMDLDPESYSDCAVMKYLQQGLPPEPEVVETMARALGEGDVAVDAGANNGFFSLLMSKLVGTKGKVFAFEPSPVNLKRLRRNLDLNEAFNVEVIDKPLWSSETEIDFYLREDDGSNSAFGNAGDTPTKMTTTTVEKCVIDRPIALMKIDVEGAELEVLRGTMARAFNFIIEMNEDTLKTAGNGQDAIHEMLEDWGYERFVIHPDASFPTCVPYSIPIRSRFANTNILYSDFLAVTRMWPEVLI